MAKVSAEHLLARKLKPKQEQARDLYAKLANLKAQQIEKIRRNPGYVDLKASEHMSEADLAQQQTAQWQAQTKALMEQAA